MIHAHEVEARYGAMTLKCRSIRLSAVKAPETVVPPVTPVDAVCTMPEGFDEALPVTRSVPRALPTARPAWRAR